MNDNTPMMNEALFLREEAEMLHRAGRHTRAIEKYTASLQFYMGDVRTWLNRAKAYEQIGMGTEAESDYKIAESLVAEKFTVCKHTNEVTHTCRQNT